MLNKLISLIPIPIQKAVRAKDWNSLETEVCKLLDSCDLDYGRCLQEEDPGTIVCMRIAALDYWLTSLKENKISLELAHWCWSHHEAFEINDYIISLELEPSRTKLFREFHYIENDVSDREVFAKSTKPLLDNWFKLAGINLQYPALTLYDEDWEEELFSKKQTCIESWDCWEFDISQEIQSYFGRENNSMFGITKTCPMPLDANTIVFPAWMLNKDPGQPDYFPELTVQVQDKKICIWKNP